MARLTREQLRLFGSTGATSYFGEFGSKAAGSPVTTKDITTIQDLDAWVNGLQEACVTAADGSKAPFLEDLNSMQFVHSYQQSYLFQEGIPEWETNVVYYKGSVVKKINATAGAIELYCSLTDSNTGNALPNMVNDGNWAFLEFLKAGDMAIASGKKFYFDGGGDTYITEPSANVIQLITGGNVAFSVNYGDNCSILGQNLIIATTKKLYLDGGGDTYIYEDSANRIMFTAGGVNIFFVGIGGSNIGIPALSKFYLDGGTDTYIYWDGGLLYFYTGGTERLSISSGAVVVGRNFYPSANNTYNCGDSTKAWKNIYYYNLVPASFAEIKRDINYFTPDDMFESLPKMATYNYKDDEKNEPQKVGFIVEDKNKPYIDSKGEISLNGIIAQLCECVKNQDKRIQALESK